MKPTELVYSSHDRSEYLHKDWIVQRALENWNNKTVFYLPMSSGSRKDQEYSWGTFSWYFDRFRQFGLDPRTFMYEDSISRHDAQLFFDWLLHSEVVILGGGAPETGMDRYRAMGGKYFGNSNAFLETLRTRQVQGKLTVGFSAGAAQLCEYSCDDYTPAFGLMTKVITTLHYESASDPWLYTLAHRHPDCMVFGLPNDSGVATAQGHTGQGNFWQLIWFITDNSWDRPEDQWHIKTRQGARIEHKYADGRSWSFNGGDIMLRVWYRDGGRQAWVKKPDCPVFHDRDSQRETHYRSVEEILGER